MKFAQYCFCTVVDHKALRALLQVTDGGAYKDNHPWVIAAELLKAAQARDEAVVLMLATIAPEPTSQTNEDADAPVITTSPGVMEFAYWTTVQSIEVNRFRQGAESRVRFEKLDPVSELWSSLDSLLLMPSQERLRREALEGLRASRQALDEHSLHPYAICEVPAFVLAHRARQEPH